VAALLAEHDQRLEAPLARLDVGRRELARRDVGLLAVTPLLVRGVFGALAGDPRGDFACGRLVRGLLGRSRRRGCGGLGDRLRYGLVGLAGAGALPPLDDLALGGRRASYAARVSRPWGLVCRPQAARAWRPAPLSSPPSCGRRGRHGAWPQAASLRAQLCARRPCGRRACAWRICPCPRQRSCERAWRAS